MNYKVELSFTGTENYILEAMGIEEAIELAVEKFEDAHPGMIVTDTRVEILGKQEEQELRYADRL